MQGLSTWIQDKYFHGYSCLARIFNDLICFSISKQVMTWHKCYKNTLQVLQQGVTARTKPIVCPGHLDPTNTNERCCFRAGDVEGKKWKGLRTNKKVVPALDPLAGVQSSETRSYQGNDTSTQVPRPDRGTRCAFGELMWAEAQSNCRHEDFQSSQSSALPTELPAHRRRRFISSNLHLFERDPRDIIATLPRSLDEVFLSRIFN